MLVPPEVSQEKPVSLLRYPPPFLESRNILAVELIPLTMFPLCSESLMPVIFNSDGIIRLDQVDDI